MISISKNGEQAPRKTPWTLKALYFFVVLGVSAVFLRTFVIDSFIVSGDSMAPTVVDGDYVFINKLAYLMSSPGRDDVVVGNFRDDGVRVIKRVVGLPREWIIFEGNTASVRRVGSEESLAVRTLYPEALVEHLGTSTDYAYRLDPYEYFLLGDNTLFSSDSREFGPVDYYAIHGKVFLNVSFKNKKLDWY